MHASNELRASPAVSITAIGRCPNTSFRIIRELLLQSLNICPSNISRLVEYEPSLYLREVGVKYWDNSIVIWKKNIEELVEHTFFS